MASAAYQLLQKGLDPLGAHGWRHALATGQVVIPNPNEIGESGPLLHLVLRAARPHWMGLKSDYDGAFEPDPTHEALVVWLIDQGADPWVEHEGRTAWSEALYRGWPQVMRHLANHPCCPPREVLQAQMVKRGHGGEVRYHAPAAFAARGQFQALEEWARLGLDVNLGVAQGQSAGAMATTPQMIDAWVALGGDVSAPTARGQSLPQVWSFSSDTQRAAMERAWARHQPADPRPMRERMDALFDPRPPTSKVLLLTHLKRLGLDRNVPAEDGTFLWQAWWPHFQSAPKSANSFVADYLLRPAPADVLRQAVLTGLLRVDSSRRHTHFPSTDHLKDLVMRQRLGAASHALEDLATELVAHPHGLALVLELGRHMDAAAHAALDPGSSPGSIREPGFHRAVDFWTPWFFRPVPQEPAGQGWLALAHMLAAGIEVKAGTYNPLAKLMLAIVDRADPARLQPAAPLLGVAQLLSQIQAFGQVGDADLDAWSSGTLGGWAQSVRPMERTGTGLSAATLELALDALRQASKSSRDMSAVAGKVAALAQVARLEASFERAPPPSAASRARM